MIVWKPRIKENNTELPESFVPRPYTVHIGRGKICSEATGNRRLKVVVDNHLHEYKQAATKIEKSIIVSKIVDIIQDACPMGAFVKFQKGKWWEVGDYAAREKVGSMLRDALSEKYRSSSKAKLARRKQAKEAVYEAAKRNVINAILSIKHDDTTDMNDETKEKEVTKKQSPEESSSSPTHSPKRNTIPTLTEEDPTTRTDLQVLRDLKQEKSMEVSTDVLSCYKHSNWAPMQTLPNSFYDINYSNAAVGLQWYSL